MKSRISSGVVYRVLAIAVTATATNLSSAPANAQGGAGYYTNPDTGIVYRQIARTIERPVVETKIESREQTVYRPQTVTESKPETRISYTPVLEHKWEPRLQGRWNPFRQPTVAYHHVPQMHWEAKSEVVNRVNTRTEWVAEKRTVDVPRQLVRMEREHKVDFEPIGRVAPGSSQYASPSDTIASRLRPLDSSTQIAPLGTLPGTSSLVSASNQSSGRTTHQGGIPATELQPGMSMVPGQAIPPINNGGVGVATLPPLPFLR